MAPHNPSVRAARPDPDPDKAYPDRVALRRKLDRITDMLATLVIVLSAIGGMLIVMALYFLFR